MPQNKFIGATLNARNPFVIKLQHLYAQSREMCASLMRQILLTTIVYGCTSALTLVLPLLFKEILNGKTFSVLVFIGVFFTTSIFQYSKLVSKLISFSDSEDRLRWELEKSSSPNEEMLFNQIGIQNRHLGRILCATALFRVFVIFCIILHIGFLIFVIV